MLVIGILAALVVFVFSVALKQKNEMGVIMGIGCGLFALLFIF